MKNLLILFIGILFTPFAYSQEVSVKQEAYVKVDKMPEFPGGQVALVKHLSKNIKYPAESKKNKVKGKVVVSFVIDKIGKVTNVKVVKSLNEECDKEAVRVISTMPNWIPGEKDGQKVDVLFSLPINFE